MAIRIFYASDIHGSEKCFKKFLRAGEFYKVQILIMGGDITGKMIIPVIQNTDGNFSFSFLGTHYNTQEPELQTIEQRIRDSGYYPYRTTPEEASELASNQAARDKLFSRVIADAMQKLVRLADERLRNKPVKCFVNPGNDDIFDIDSILKSSETITVPEGQVFKIDDSHEMISTGFANKTPWDCPRDIDEERLSEKIEDMAARVSAMPNCIFNFHVPPHNTIIDEAPKLDERMTPLRGPGGDLLMEPVGSLAVRKAIEKYQPLLGLHGHIHEGRGSNAIGRTTVLNCGSEYSEGILRGIIITLGDSKLKYQFTSG